MKRKMLISIALITIMLLNCMMPLFVVNAAEGGEIQLNSKLYKAVKENLKEQGFAFESNDVTRTLVISEEVKATITNLDLNEGAISDLTGLENFTSLTHLELSGNNLTKNSNLAAIGNLPLNYLDLSTNQLEDVSEIDGLINTIKSNNGTVILSGQTVTIVEEAIIDEEEDSDDAIVAEYKLPKILEKAGFIKSVWMKESGISEKGTGITPSLYKMSNPVTEGNDFIQIRIASDKGEPYKGLYKLEIYIYDDPTEANSSANLNPASSNILNGSRFYFYVVVHGSNSTAVTTKDTNLYKAIKQQLTAGQTVNNELDSYPFEVDAKGEIIYDECTYVKNGNELILTIVGEDEPTYILDTDSQIIYTCYKDERGNCIKGEYYTSVFEKTLLTTTDENGVVTLIEGYIIPHNGVNRNLYIKAYDEPKTFVISNEDLVNKITSLILNNKEIRDLTGIEKFVGLKSYLNVSHNYLSDIEPIYNLQANKDDYESKIQEKYNYYLNTREYGNLNKSLSQTKSSKAAADGEVKNISNAVKEILTKFEEASKIEKYKETQKTQTDAEGKETTVTERTENENYQKELEAKAKEIDEIVKKIYGYTETDATTGQTTRVKGYLELLASHLNSTVLNVNDLYSYLSALYNVYNNEYKLATLLTPELNYLDLEEYIAYNEKIYGISASSESVKGLAMAEVSRLATLEANQGLSALDKILLRQEFGINFDGESENPLQEYFNETLPDTPGTRVFWAELIERFREVALYSEMANYCLIKRMEEKTTAVSQCYCEEYLKERIVNFEYEGIDTKVEEIILKNLQENIDDPSNGLYTAFKRYMNSTFDYTNKNDDSDVRHVETCKGPYQQLENIVYNTTVFENVDEITDRLPAELANDEEIAEVYKLLTNKQIIKTINIKETIDYEDIYQGELNLYKEVVALSSKFITNSGEVSRYITLPKLRKLDISYNAYLEGIEKISTLTGLRELYANANYITDITEVDWAAIKYLRKLGLAYNYIPSIKPLEELEYLVELDASHNLIAGYLDFNFTKSQLTLMDLDLSYNQITDITTIMQFLDWKTNGNDGNYLAREDTININLNNQNINLNVEDPIFLSDYPSTIDIELPKIFTQLLAIDVERTSFGETSQNGRIESEGKYVTLNTKSIGEKEGVVEVIAMSGNGKPVETCVGEGTKATIKYVVTDRKVTSVKVEPSEDVVVKPGETQVFTATVEGEDLLDKTVTWSVLNNTSEKTTIAEDGTLTVGEDETAETINVMAISNFDTTVNDVVTVTVIEKEEPTEPEDPDAVKVTVEPSENVIVRPGEEEQFTATVTGKDVTDDTVTWYVEGNQNDNTTISEDGKLVVAENETAETINVIAISNFDTTVNDTVKVTVIEKDEPTDPENPDEIKITVDPSENVTVNAGEEEQFTVTVTGENITSKEIKWSLTGFTSQDTNISSEGKLTVGADETADEITLTVDVTVNDEIKETKTIIIKINKAQEPENPGVELELGYKVEDEFLVGVSPKTPVEDFKEILLDNENYNVVIKKEGETITSGNMGTGMYIQIQDENGEVVKDTNGNLLVYEVVVKGDVNGDGVANSLDSILIKAHRNEVKDSILVGSAFRAADIDDDNKVNTMDSKLLLYHRAEVKGYNLNYTK